jgi:hypothetical protein
VTRVAVAVAATAAATVPFALPYLTLRRSGFNPRSIVETQKYSADVYAYFTAEPALRFWGAIARAWPHAEGALFPGLTITALATVAVIGSWRLARADAPERWPRAARAAGWVTAACATLSILLLFGWSLRLPTEHAIVKITSFPRMLLVSALAAAIWFSASPRARRTLGRWCESPIAVFALITVAAMAMSFGPAIYARGRLIAAPSVYRFFYSFVPGFDGLRVPARFAMIAALGLAVMAGYGIALLTRMRSAAPLVAAAACVLIAAESCAVPIPIDQNDTSYRQHELAPLPASIAFGTFTPPVYLFIRTLPTDAVVMELPLGEPAYDVRYMFYEIAHHRALVNGYSGGAPDDYGLLTEALKDIVSRPDEAWRAVVGSTATHVIVHEQAYLHGGADVTSWLRRYGALQIAAFGGDRVLQIR